MESKSAVGYFFVELLKIIFQYHLAYPFEHKFFLVYPILYRIVNQKAIVFTGGTKRWFSLCKVAMW